MTEMHTKDDVCLQIRLNQKVNNIAKINILYRKSKERWKIDYNNQYEY